MLNKDGLRALTYLTQIGINFFVTVTMGVILGHFLDKFFSTGYIFLSIMVVIFTLSAFRNLYVISMKEASKSRSRTTNFIGRPEGYTDEKDDLSFDGLFEITDTDNEFKKDK